ncbi:hypothetical protein OG21DRAFT_1504867 [Imleria badia]|nr:hypothetical protein OG21DRAFT_1504867 [Imleria badia]
MMWSCYQGHRRSKLVISRRSDPCGVDAFAQSEQSPLQLAWMGQVHGQPVSGLDAFTFAASDDSSMQEDVLIVSSTTNPRFEHPLDSSLLRLDNTPITPPANPQPAVMTLFGLSERTLAGHVRERHREKMNSESVLITHRVLGMMGARHGKPIDTLYLCRPSRPRLTSGNAKGIRHVASGRRPSSSSTCPQERGSLGGEAAVMMNRRLGSTRTRKAKGIRFVASGRRPERVKYVPPGKRLARRIETPLVLAMHISACLSSQWKPEERRADADIGRPVGYRSVIVTHAFL